MVRGETGFVEFLDLRRHEPFWLAYAPVPSTGWSLGAMFPQGQITAKLLALSRTSLFLGSLGAVAMFAVALIIARSISRPIRELDSATQVLAGGNLDAPLPAPRGSDEVACLTASFARMREDLKRRMEELRVTTEEKARIERDLETARKIQLDILPSRFSFDPPRPEVEIYATLEPAKMVGGDFYDFFLLSGDRLFLGVGDVSGKGVPASLFMAVSKAYLKAYATYGHDPAECLAHLNDELAIENDEGMFLTVFCAEVDVKTGEGCYASGGHNPAFIVRSGGRVETLPTVRGPLIGLDAGRSFELSRFQLEPGDLLFGYSDGLVEAENTEHALYGEERAMELLSRLRGQDVRSILTAVREDVRSFAGSAAQSDDITLLGLAFKKR